MGQFDVIHRIAVFSGVSNTVPLFVVASRPNVPIGVTTETPAAWWKGTEGRWKDLAKTDPAVLGTDRVVAWAEDTYTLEQDSGTAADAPLYSPSGIEQPALNFNARPWLLSQEAGLLTPVSGSDRPWSALVVCTIPAGTDAERYVLSFRTGSGLSGAMHALGVGYTGGNLHWRVIRQPDSGTSVVVDGNTIDTSATRTYILTLRFTGTAVELRANGVVVLSDGQNVGAFNPTAFVVGALDEDGDFEWSGLVAHVLLFHARITDGSVTYYEALLAALFGSTGLRGTAFPYLFPPELTARRIEVPQGRGDPGQLRFRVLDKRVTAGDQQDREITRLLGDSEGRLAVRNSLAIYDVSDDGGATYQREFTGRVHEVELADKVSLSFWVDDPQVGWLGEIFDGTRPMVDWALPGVFVPLGILSPDGQMRYGPHPAVSPAGGVVRAASGVLANGYYIENTWLPTLEGAWYAPRPVSRENLIVTKALEEAASYTELNPGELWIGRNAPDLRVAFRPVNSGVFQHYHAGVVYNPVGQNLGFPVFESFVVKGDGSVGRNGEPEPRVSAVGIVSLDGDPAVPPVGTRGDWYIYSAAPPTPAAPLLIGITPPRATAVPQTISGVHWAVLVSGIAHGAFGGPGFPIDYPRFNEIIQDQTQPKLRFRITAGPVDALQWMAENIWPVVGYAPAITASGTLSPVSYDPPAALPTLRFDASTVVSATWQQNTTAGQINHVRIDTVRERPIPPELVDRDSPSDMLREFDGDRIIVARDAGQKRAAFEISAKGVRTTTDSDQLEGVRQYMIGRANSVLDRFQDGPQTGVVVGRRTAANKAARVGDHALQAVPWLPDLHTKRRGGTRVMLITSKGVNQDGTYTFELLDNGPDQFVDAPTIDAVALHPLDRRHVVSITVTPPGEDDRAVLEIATTLSGVAAPASDSGRWAFAVSVSGTGQQTVVVPNLASRRGHHFRAIGRGPGKIPSDYSAVSSIITAAITPPSNVAATTSGQAVLMTWANGDPNYGVMPVLSYDTNVAPASGFLTRALPPGSTRFLFTELSPPGSARVGVKHVDDFGGDSVVAEANATIGSAIQLSAPQRLTVLQGRGDNDPGSSRHISIGVGVELQWAVTEPYASTVVHYDTSSSFTAPVALSGISADRYRVMLPLNNTTYYFRAYHQRIGFTTSAATEAVSSKPVVLVREPTVNDGFAGGSAYLSTDDSKRVYVNATSADPDSERFYYEVSLAEYVEPTVASSVVLRSQFPASVDTGLVLTQNAYLWGKFWNATKGFGQGVKHQLGNGAGQPVVASLTLQEILDSGRKVQVSATFSGASYWQTWERDGSNWPTGDGSETGVPDDSYRRYYDTVERSSYQRSVPDSTTRRVIARAFTAAGIGGPRTTASIAVGAGAPGSEGGVMFGFGYAPTASYLELTWAFNETIQTPSPDPRWTVKIYRTVLGTESLVASRDPRLDPGGTNGTPYVGGYRDTDVQQDAGGTFYQLLYRFVLSDSEATYPDIEYTLPVSDYFAEIPL